MQDAVAVTLAGTLVATPFAYVYDTVILAVAVVLLTERHLAEGGSARALSVQAESPERSESAAGESDGAEFRSHLFGFRSSTRMLLILAWLAPFLSKALMPLGVPIVPIAALGLVLLVSRDAAKGHRYASEEHSA